tara:strand:- start:78 stop:1121 length:1044 start_codon:yes stop_codon:yes gene_type:complete
MTENISNVLDIEKVTKALAVRLPHIKGPWKYTKTSFGQSNPTFILTGKNSKLVLRKKPFGNLLNSAHMIEREFRVMSALKFTNVPVPKMYYLCEDEREIGTPYFVMEYVEGISFLDPRTFGLKFESRKKVYLENIKGLANLHKICPNKVGLSDFGKSGNYFLRQFSRWSVQYENSKTELIEPLENLIEWLGKNLPKVQEVSPRLVHGDWRIDNLIFDRNNYKLIGVFDWELSTLGDPRADLATQIMQWSMDVGEEGRGLNGVNRKKMGIPDDTEFLEEYSKFLNLDKVPNLHFAIPFCYFRMAAILQGVKKRALDGNASNPSKGLKMGDYINKYAIKGLQSIKQNFK